MIWPQMKRSPVFSAAVSCRTLQICNYLFNIFEQTLVISPAGYVLWLRISISIVVFIGMTALVFSLKKSKGKNCHLLISFFFFFWKKMPSPKFVYTSSGETTSLRSDHPTWA